jgi:hypothetical protein
VSLSGSPLGEGGSRTGIYSGARSSAQTERAAIAVALTTQLAQVSDVLKSVQSEPEVQRSKEEKEKRDETKDVSVDSLLCN